MTDLLCTTRLLDALPAKPAPAGEAAAADNRLGTWTATLVPLRPARLVLAVSEHARLALVLSATPYESLLERFPDALYGLLLGLKLPPELARRERDALSTLIPRAGRDSGTLGALKSYGIELRAMWEAGLSRSPEELSLHLAELATEHLEGGTAAQAVRRRFHLLPEHTEALGL